MSSSDITTIIARFKKLPSKDVTDGDFQLLADVPEGRNGRDQIEKVLIPKNRNLTDEGFSAIGKLTKLTQLDVEGTKVTDVSIAALNGASENLTTLNLAGTQVTGAGIAQLNQFPKLHEVDLEGIPLTIEAMDWFEKCPSLREVRLAKTHLTGDMLKRLSETRPDLAVLNLENNPDITEASLASLATFKNLGVLNLAGCPVTAGQLKQVQESGGLGELLNLSVARTMLDEAGIAAIRGFTTLEELDLSELNLTDGEFEQIVKPLKNLQILRLNKTSKLTGRALQSIDSLDNLEELHINGSAIDDTGLPYLVRLKKLHLIEATDSSCTPNGAFRLKSQLPKLKIHVAGQVI